MKSKNVAPFAGTNLLLNKIEQLKKISEIDRIVVTSDLNMMLEMARNVGVLINKPVPKFCDEAMKNFGKIVGYVAESAE